MKILTEKDRVNAYYVPEKSRDQWQWDVGESLLMVMAGLVIYHKVWEG